VTKPFEVDPAGMAAAGHVLEQVTNKVEQNIRNKKIRTALPKYVKAIVKQEALNLMNYFDIPRKHDAEYAIGLAP